MPWLDLLAKFRGYPPDRKPALDQVTNQIIQERLEDLGEREAAEPGTHADPIQTTPAAPDLQPADGAITTVLVGIDAVEAEDPARLLDRLAALEELAAKIFRRGDVTYPAGPAEILLLCPERTPAEVRDAIARLRRQWIPQGTLRAALFSLDGDPRDSLPQLKAALEACRATGLELIDRTLSIRSADG